MKRPTTRQTVLDCTLLALLAAMLIAPLFHIQYLNNWMSIEGSFIADARFIRDHFPHPMWHALWYCGTRFDYIYPPLTRFGPAILSLMLGIIPAQAYHIYVAASYCIAIAAVYLLVRIWTSSRWTAWLSALTLALVSPVFLLFPDYFRDSAYGMPIRLNFLVKWGEGPHMDALAWIPAALGLLYLALQRRSSMALAGCAVACALVVSNNLYGALALLIFFPVAVWAIWLAERQRAVWLRALAIVALTYGLCAWWLTPSFVTLTARNLMLVALPGNILSKVVGLAALALFLAVSWMFARSHRNPEWPVFVGGALFFFALDVLGNRWFNFRIAGEPMRFLPELDLMLILAGAEALRRLSRFYRWIAAAAMLIVLAFSAPYLLHAWSMYPPDPAFARRVEYRMGEWVAQNLPGSRTFSTGSVSFWFTAWRDLSEVTGGSDQGMQTEWPALARWQLAMGDDPDRDIAWMVALGSDAIIVHEAASQEIYHTTKNPRKYMGKLPVLYDRDGDIIYRVPRRFPGLARVVNESQSASLPPIPWSNDNRAQLQAYAATAEGSPSQVNYQRVSIMEMRLRAETQSGESVLVEESWDPGWHAYDSGRPVPIRQDNLGFMRLQTAAGAHDIRLVYEWSTESRTGHVFTGFALGLTLVMAWSGWRSKRLPASPSHPS